MVELLCERRRRRRRERLSTFASFQDEERLCGSELCFLIYCMFHVANVRVCLQSSFHPNEKINQRQHNSYFFGGPLAWFLLCLPLSVLFLLPLYLNTPECNWCSGVGEGIKWQRVQEQGGRGHTGAAHLRGGFSPHLVPRCSKQVGDIFVVFLFGLDITGSSVIRSFCFRSSYLSGGLGGGAGMTAHCAASSQFFFLFVQNLQPSFVCPWGFLLIMIQ